MRPCLWVQTDGGEVARKFGALQSLARDFPASRAVWAELLGTVAESLDSEQESLDPTEAAAASMPQLQGLCVDAILSLAKHAQRMQDQNGGAPQANRVHSAWRAECTAAEAIVRHMQLEMSRGDTMHAVQLVQASCEWFSCPRVSCACPLSISTCCFSCIRIPSIFHLYNGFQAGLPETALYLSLRRMFATTCSVFEHAVYGLLDGCLKA